MTLLKRVYRLISKSAVRQPAVFATVLAGLTLTPLAGCNQAGATASSIDVPLEYRPRSADALPTIEVPTGGVKVFVSPTVDSRSEKREVGQNREKATSIPVYASGTMPADFVTRVLKDELQSTGLNVAGDASGTQRQIDSEITQFQVIETNTYSGTVNLKLKVVDPTGKVLFEGVGSGTSSNFGRSRSPENYQETLSDALKNAIGKVLHNPAFAQALNEKS